MTITPVTIIACISTKIFLVEFRVENFSIIFILIIGSSYAGAIQVPINTI